MSLPKRKAAVILREVPEGAILFSTETEVYFSLNVVGARVWRLLPPECTHEEELIARIHGDYPEVSRETIAADVRGLLKDLGGEGLVEHQDAF